MKKNSIIIRLVSIACLFSVFFAACNTQEQNVSQPSYDQTDQPTPIVTDKFGEGNLASIALVDVKNYSESEIVQLLVSQWLSSYIVESVTEDSIADYSVEKITMVNNAPDYEIVAKLIFSIKPNQYSDNWASMTTSSNNSNDPWWHLGSTFGVIKEKDTLILKLLPGWGT